MIREMHKCCQYLIDHKGVYLNLGAFLSATVIQYIDEFSVYVRFFGLLVSIPIGILTLIKLYKDVVKKK